MGNRKDAAGRSLEFTPSVIEQAMTRQNGLCAVGKPDRS